MTKNLALFFVLFSLFFTLSRCSENEVERTMQNRNQTYIAFKIPVEASLIIAAIFFMSANIVFLLACVLICVLFFTVNYFDKQYKEKERIKKLEEQKRRMKEEQERIRREQEEIARIEKEKRIREERRREKLESQKRKVSAFFSRVSSLFSRGGKKKKSDSKEKFDDVQKTLQEKEMEFNYFSKKELKSCSSNDIITWLKSQKLPKKKTLYDVVGKTFDNRKINGTFLFALCNANEYIEKKILNELKDLGIHNKMALAMLSKQLSNSKIQEQ